MCFPAEVRILQKAGPLGRSRFMLDRVHTTVLCMSQFCEEFPFSKTPTQK